MYQIILMASRILHYVSNVRKCPRKVQKYGLSDKSTDFSGRKEKARIIWIDRRKILNLKSTDWSEDGSGFRSKRQLRAVDVFGEPGD
jgi:hypothetical protein